MGKKWKRVLVSRRAAARSAAAEPVTEAPVAETVVVQEAPAPARETITNTKKKIRKEIKRVRKGHRPTIT